MEVGAGFPVHHGGRLLRYRLRATGSSGWPEISLMIPIMTLLKFLYQ
jgi:hypothetical protein